MPIDEMLIDLRTVLEAFDDAPSHLAFAHVQCELKRIEYYCEEMLMEEE